MHHDDDTRHIVHVSTADRSRLCSGPWPGHQRPTQAGKHDAARRNGPARAAR
jgi:hypothetical protein